MASSLDFTSYNFLFSIKECATQIIEFMRARLSPSLKIVNCELKIEAIEGSD